MRIDIASLHEGENKLELTESPSGLDLGEVAAEVKSGISVSLRLHKREDEVIVWGTASGTMAEECSRCLRPSDRKFRVEFEAFCDRIGVYDKQKKAKTREEEGETFVIHHDGKTLDLGPVLREAIVLSLPIRVLCRDDCKGLCPVCGTNLNESKCDCAAAQTDARWNILDRLKKKESKREN